MDIEKVEDKYSEYYRYSESGIRNRNIELYEKIINHTIEDIKFKEKFYLFVNNFLRVPKCYCGCDLKFKDMIKGYTDFCSRRCMYNSSIIKKKRKNTCIDKYGVDNPSKSLGIKDKVKKTNNDKYGVDYPTQLESIIEENKKYFISKYGVDNPSKVKEVRDKANKTIKELYGVDHIMQNDIIKNNIKNYFISKYGVDNPSKVKEVRDKANKTIKELYGVEHVLKSPIFMDKLKKTNTEKYGFEFYTKTDKYKSELKEFIFNKNSKIINNNEYKLINTTIGEYEILCLKCSNVFIIQRQLWRNRTNNNLTTCLFCNPIDNSISIDEKILLNYVKDNYHENVLENFKLDRKEIDIYIPELKLGFEFNGLYWHSELNKEKNYHFNKYRFFQERGILVFSIWEDDWLYKQDIVKSMILNKLGKTPTKIFARKCQIKVVEDNKLVRKFLEDNHIQGFVGSKIKLGLFHNDELVSLMTFGNLRKSLGQKSQEGSYELLRFCNKLNTTVVGGASKLFKYFLNNYEAKDIITYSLNTHSDGNLYKELGFILEKSNYPNYFWIKNKKRYHRFSFRKDKLVKNGNDINKTEVEIMYNMGYYRVFDSGSKRWTYKT